MIPPFRRRRGELPGTCFISDTSFSAKASPPLTFLPHSPSPHPYSLSFLPQASLFKFPCCQPTLARRHSLPVSWLNCWRCLLLLGNPPSFYSSPTTTTTPLPLSPPPPHLRSFVPSTERGGSDTACVNLTPPASNSSTPQPLFSCLLLLPSLSRHLISG